MRHYLLNDDRTIREVSMLEWAEGADLIEGVQRRDVGDEDIAGYRVSTKFIGIDMTPSFLRLRVPNTPPRVFECAIFDQEGNPYIVDRPSSWDEAAKVHQRVCDSLRALQTNGIEITRAMLAIVSVGARGAANG